MRPFCNIMKRVLFFLFLGYALALHAETIKLNDGSLISGSILSQTEYTLNLATSYGNITLNQREIEQILPDKHRIILKGGTQLIGVITDMDEFNLKLQTEDGNIVNIDMPQIVSVEAYDYDRGENAQKELVEKKQEQAAQVAAQTATVSGAAATHPATVEAEGGLTFDSDINQVFGAQQATVVNGQVVTPSAQVQTATPKPMTNEEAFLKGVKTGEISQQDYASAAKEELLKKNQAKKTTKEPKKRPSEKSFYKYFALQAGVMPTDLKLDNSEQPGYTAGDQEDVGGSGVAVSGKFLWRIKDSNLWVGPQLGIANIPNNEFEDKDPSVAGNPSFPDPKVKTSGMILDLGVAANYYILPSNKFSVYATASAGYEMLKLNYRGELNSTTINSDSVTGSLGLGVETWFDDLMLGLEVREVFAQRSGRLKESSAANTVVQAQFSWKF